MHANVYSYVSSTYIIIIYNKEFNLTEVIGGLVFDGSAHVCT